MLVRSSSQISPQTSTASLMPLTPADRHRIADWACHPVSRGEGCVGQQRVSASKKQAEAFAGLLIAGGA